MKNIIEILADRGIVAVKASTAKGGEYHSPCPGCGGSDRFHVWPEQSEGGGSYWCRRCGKGGDSIQFRMDFCGQDFRTAAAECGKQVSGGEENSYRKPESRKAVKREFSPENHVGPAEIWREKAETLVSWAAKQLMETDEKLRWLKSRGIQKETAERFHIGYVPEDLYRPRESWGLETVLKDDGKKKKLWIPSGIVIPLMDSGVVHRIRIRRFTDEGPKYYVLPGSGMATMINRPKSRAFVVVETELDAILLDQEVGGVCGSVAVGSATTKPDAAAYGSLKKSLCILNAVDFDKAGIQSFSWWREQFEQAEQWPVPAGKDPGEAFQEGISLKDWVIAGLPPALTIGLAPNTDVVVERVPGDEDVEAPAVIGEIIERPKAHPDLLEYFELLKRYPVKVLAANDRTQLLENQGWAAKNWEISRKISNMTYFNSTVLNYLHAHPDDVISSGNFWVMDGKAAD